MTPLRRTMVLDTAALLAGLGPQAAGSSGASGGTDWVVPPAVHGEVRPGGPTGRSLEHALEAGLKVRAPSAEALERIEEVLMARGETRRLSLADREVLALALDVRAEGRVEIWTDDYSVQNVAEGLGIETRPIMTKGIRSEATWYVRCTGCARYPDSEAEGGTCPICGSPLKRTRRPPQGRTR